MSDDSHIIDLFRARNEREQRLSQGQADRPLKSGGGSGTSDGMEGRVTRLEVLLEGVGRDLSEIRDQMRVLPTLATKRDLDSWRWQWLAIGAAVVALIVGGITGGLALINRSVDAPSPVPAIQPIIIQLPAAAGQAPTIPHK